MRNVIPLIWTYSNEKERFFWVLKETTLVKTKKNSKMEVKREII